MARTGILRILAVSALATVCLLHITRAQADTVTDWNVIALNATAIPPNAILQSRALAIVHGAIYDAVRAVDRKSGVYAVNSGGAGWNFGGGRSGRGRAWHASAARACAAAHAGCGPERQPVQYP